MKYTNKEQIHGIKFYHHSNPNQIYEIDSLDCPEDKITIVWNNGNNTSYYHLYDILGYINDKKWWIVIDNPNPTDPQYEVY